MAAEILEIVTQTRNELALLAVLGALFIVWLPRHTRTSLGAWLTDQGIRQPEHFIRVLKEIKGDDGKVQALTLLLDKDHALAIAILKLIAKPIDADRFLVSRDRTLLKVAWILSVFFAVLAVVGFWSERRAEPSPPAREVSVPPPVSDDVVRSPPSDAWSPQPDGSPTTADATRPREVRKPGGPSTDSRCRARAETNEHLQRSGVGLSATCGGFRRDLAVVVSARLHLLATESDLNGAPACKGCCVFRSAGAIVLDGRELAAWDEERIGIGPLSVDVRIGDDRQRPVLTADTHARIHARITRSEVDWTGCPEPGSSWVVGTTILPGSFITVVQR